MATLGELAGVTAASTSKPAAVTGAAAVRSSALQPMNLHATMQGQRVLTEHLYVVAAAMTPMIQALTWYFGEVIKEQAKANHFPNIDTQATYDSIQTSELMPLPGGAAVDIFVTTPYSKFLEFGFIHHLSGNWIFNPFMIPAVDQWGPEFVNAIEQAASVLGSLKFFSGAATSSPAADILSSVRAGLYSYSKFAGDIQVLGFPGLSKSRGLAVRGAKGLGNVQAIRSGQILSRAGRLAAGRLGGSFRGGSFSGGIATGATGRIYNRIGGSMFGDLLKGFK